MVEFIMQFKNIHFIINPASGKEEPILTYLYKALCDTKINWQVIITTCDKDVFKAAKKLIGKTDLVVVYGGDGTVTHVAEALAGSNTPMAIIPGGTANVMSKELGMPQDSEAAIAMIISGKSRIINIDIGKANNTTFLLRVNFGIMADMILNVDTDLKSKIGQFAYGITALKTTIDSKPINYKMLLDGRQIEEQGVSLTITNAGNIGIGDMSFLPGISISDGLLDVILLKDVSPLSLLQVAGSTMLQQDSAVLKHWKCKTATIVAEGRMKYLRDDCEAVAKTVKIKILPHSLKVLVPNH